MEETIHQPVLLTETIEALRLIPGAVALDATLGGGGHTRAMLAGVRPGGKVVAIDADPEALTRFYRHAEHAASDSLLAEAFAEQALVLVQGNYSRLREILDGAGVEKCDAILADLGFSSDQIAAAGRGFSFMENGPLDMRFDQTTEVTAAMLVNTLTSEALARVFHEYGDENNSMRIARAIVAARQTRPITTTVALREIIESAFPRRQRHAMKIHPATRTFQALRIAVNREFEHLEAFLIAAVERLKPDGRLAIITFHSGEDARVKRFFKQEARGCVCPPRFPVCRCGRTPTLEILTPRPQIVSAEERMAHPRSRSAKLRVARKL